MLFITNQSTFVIVGKLEPPIQYELLIDLPGYKLKAGAILELTEHGRTFTTPNKELLLIASVVQNTPDKFKRL